MTTNLPYLCAKPRNVYRMYCALSTLIEQLTSYIYFGMHFCLFELWLGVLVNSYSHVETLPPFYGTSTQHLDIMTSKNVLQNIPQLVNKKLLHVCIHGLA